MIGSRVSSEQPSVIDDPSIKNGFYGAPTAACVFCQKDFAFSVPDAFEIAQAKPHREGRVKIVEG